MDRRNIAKVLLGSAAGGAILSERAAAQSCLAPCYPQTKAEQVAGVTPTDLSYPPYKFPARYGAVGDGINSDDAALQRQINACISAGAEMELLNPFMDSSGLLRSGYLISNPLVITGQLKITGGGYGKSAILTTGCNAFNIAAGVTQVELHGFRIASAVRYSTTPNSLKAINIQGTTTSHCGYHTYRDLFIDGFETGIQANGLRDSVIDHVFIGFGKNGIVAAEQTVNNFVTNSEITGDYTRGSGSCGAKVGDGVAATEGWNFIDITFAGFDTTIHGFGCNNSQVVSCYLDFFSTYGVLLQSGASNAATNWLITGNYMAATGAAASTGVRCLNNLVSSDPRGNRIAQNDILVYGGSTLAYGILVDGSQETRNTIIGNHCKSTTGYDCKIATGSGHRVIGNTWLANGFVASVMTTYEGNEGTLVTPTLTRQTSGPNFVYHSTGAPTSGTYKRGDIAWASAPAAGAPPGYVCVTAGSPGTWKAMANLSL